MEKFLATLVKNTEQLKAESKAQSTMLQSIYKLDEQQIKENKQIITLEKEQLEEAKKQTRAQEKTANEQKRRDKVKSSDKDGLLTKLVGKGKDADKIKKKGLLGGIMDTLVGGAALAVGLKAAVAALVAVGGAAITAYFASPEFRSFVDELSSDLFTTIKEGYTKAVVMGGGKIADTGGDLINKALYGTETTDSTKSLQNERGQAQAELAIASGPGSEVDAEEIKRLGEKVKRMQDLVKASVDIEKSEAAIKRLEALRDEKIYDIETDTMVPAFVGENSAAEANIKKEKERLKEFKKTMAELAELEEEYKQRHIEYLKKTDPNFDPELYQSGGFVGRVPNQGGNGDRFRTLVEDGSVVLNQTAAGYQGGGLVPVMLEQGEQVFGPRDPNAGTALMLNSLIPRFQTGGLVGDPISQSEASGARDGVTSANVKTTPKDVAAEAESAKAATNKAGAAAIIAAAEASTGIYKGVGEMCARTTRDVLAIAGHPAAKKTTSVADLDVPVGYGPSTVNPDLAGSFAGSDMGTVYEDPKSAPPGSVIMWRGTYDVAKYGPDAVTHVGLKGNGNDIYHHGRGPGWRKDTMSNYTPDFAVDLNGEATGFVPGSKQKTGAFESLGGLAGSVVGLASAIMTEVLAPLFQALIGGIGDFGSTGGGMNLFGGGDITPSSEPLTGDSAAKAEQMFEYIVSKGYSEAQAKGIVANIQRESNFDAMARSGDDGGPGGLFQWKGPRQTAEVASLVNSGNWKGQIDYALKEDVGPKFKDATAGMDAMDASMWWAEKWERPASLSNARNKHSHFLPSYGFQQGGVASMKGSSYAGSAQMMERTRDQFVQDIAAASTPIVIPVPTGGGGGGGNSVVAGSGTPMPPLSSEDSSIMAMEYKYRITMGASV